MTDQRHPNRRLALQALAGAGAALALGAHAQGAFPNRPITWVVPYAPGAATDILTRRLAQDLGSELGQSVVVENMPGGGTVNAAAQLVRAKPDGYRIMTADSATLALNPALMDKLPYDPQSSFTPIGLFARFPLVLVVNKNVAAKSVGQLIELARQRGGDMNYASAGLGSPHHLAMELFLEDTGTRMTHVPYNGAGPALTDLLAGRTELMFSSLGPIAQYLQSGALRALAVSGAQRFPGLPEVATVAETEPRLKSYEVYAWQGVVAPAGLAQDVRTRLSAGLQKVASTDAVKKRFLELGIEAVTSTPAAFETYAANEARKWSALVKARGIKRE